MAEEIVQRLREASKVKYGARVNVDRELLMQAADAIGDLIAKATPKRVGFTEWKGCRNTRYKCPLCTKYVRNDEKYCHKCGQALMFPIISFTPFVQEKRQETIISWPDETPMDVTDA